MFYQASGSWFTGGKRGTDEARHEASMEVRASEAVRQSEWLGWDGWVNPEPMRTVPQDPKTLV